VAVEVPSDSSRTRAIVIVVAVVVALVIGAGFVWAAIVRNDDSDAKQAAIEPAQETTGQPTPASPAASSTATPSVQPSSTVPEARPATSASMFASSKVAFSLGGRVYVANVDGTNAVSVAPAGGAYTLSPDGTKLAVAYTANAQQTTGGAVAVYDTLSGVMSPVGANAFPEAPRWAPDATWLVYTSGSEKTGIQRVDTVGGAGTTLAKTGASARVSPGGEFIAYSASVQPGPGDSITIARTDGGGAATLAKSAGALSWAWGPKGQLYFTKQGDDYDRWDLWVASPPKFKPKRLGTASLTTPAYLLHGLSVSADGAYVLAAATGDDDYSRLWVFDVDERRFLAISTRRDAYPYGWAPDGSILYFEGNAYQGEESSLMTIRPDGTRRLMVVSGAQR